ncbi:MAG: hypothetical protein K2Q25_08380 [Mycobacteriaceae bacterium]|nr:hypothetical protein [Mycobacteriaceae bacterium]
MKPAPEQFPYAVAAPAVGAAGLMPLLPVILTAGGVSVTVSGLVDSGAAVSVLPRAVGERLGLNWDQQTVPVRLGGSLSGDRGLGRGGDSGGRSVHPGAAGVRVGRVGRDAGRVGTDELLPRVRGVLVPVPRGIRGPAGVIGAAADECREAEPYAAPDRGRKAGPGG